MCCQNSTGPNFRVSAVTLIITLTIITISHYVNVKMQS